MNAFANPRPLVHEVEWATAQALIRTGWSVEVEPTFGIARPDLFGAAPSSQVFIIDIRLSRESVHFAAIAQVASYVRLAAETRDVPEVSGVLLTTATASPRAAETAGELGVLILGRDPRIPDQGRRYPEPKEPWTLATDWAIKLGGTFGATYAPSQVLDSFVVAAATRGPAAAERLHLERSNFREAGSERDLAVRLLTGVASAFRSAVGQEKEARAIRTGDDAFDEYQVVRALRVDSKREAAQTELAHGLSIAVERLGPLPGGRLASFKGPAGEPAIVESVEPTDRDLEQIAWHAGSAVGHLQASDHADAVRVFRAVKAPSLG